MKVWIDLSNSPHPLLFAPVARRLQRDGHDVVVTARDNAQTLELAHERWSSVEVIGRSSPRGRRAKLAAIYGRITALRRWASGARPDVALSHNSYAQIVAARTLGIPAVTAMDFEHQPANHLAFRAASLVLVPDALPAAKIRSQGASARKVIRYTGLKEELYIGDFEPDPEILSKLGIPGRPEVVAVVRTPPSRAIYHRFENRLFEEVLTVLGAQRNLICVVLARHPEQIEAIKALTLTNCVVPTTAIDSRSLIYAADAVIGAGGTMTREAAVMGIPTWSVFAGTPPAVDLWLAAQGTLARLDSAEPLVRLSPRDHAPHLPAELRRRGERIERIFTDVTLAAAGPAPRRRIGRR